MARLFLYGWDVWKTINRSDILERHLIDEGLPFTKEAVDAAHARYVKEIQEAHEAKAKEEARKAAEARKKAAESTSESGSVLDPETQRLLELAPRMQEVIIDVWNASMPRQRAGFVSKSIEAKYGVGLKELAKEVYSAYKASKGSEEGQ